MVFHHFDSGSFGYPGPRTSCFPIFRLAPYRRVPNLNQIKHNQGWSERGYRPSLKIYLSHFILLSQALSLAPEQPTVIPSFLSTMVSSSPIPHENRSELTGDAHLTRASFAHLDEKAILRKMDKRLIPMLALLYLLSFLDRGNIGNARIEGLVDDLHMTGPQYNWTC